VWFAVSSLQHLGHTVRPKADAGWIGAAGPGPSYLDPGSGGPENEFTNCNTKGSQNYALPPDVNPASYGSVSIWCDRFDVSFGAAELARV
jgi:hypothetical protein